MFSLEKTLKIEKKFLAEKCQELTCFDMSVSIVYFVKIYTIYRYTMQFGKTTQVNNIYNAGTIKTFPH